MRSEAPKLLDDIFQKLNTAGKAKYDFGTFYTVHRKGHKAILPGGEKAKVRPYWAVFFRGSVKLRKKINGNHK